MAAENILSDLHEEIKDTIGVFEARILALDGDMPAATKSKLVAECACIQKHGLVILSLIDSELIRIKKLEDPSPL